MNWLEVDKVTIFTGKDINGNRYLSQFLKDYKETFTPDMINAGCQRCLEDYYLKFTKYLQTMSQPKTQSAYKLKPKYNGIPLAFGSQIQVSNSNITDAYGKQLLENHPKGADLFESIPDTTVSDSNDVDPNSFEELKKQSRSDLDKIATEHKMDPEVYKNKGEIAKSLSAHFAELKEQANSSDEEE